MEKFTKETLLLDLPIISHIFNLANFEISYVNLARLLHGVSTVGDEKSFHLNSYETTYLKGPCLGEKLSEKCGTNRLRESLEISKSRTAKSRKFRD